MAFAKTLFIVLNSPDLGFDLLDGTRIAELENTYEFNDLNTSNRYNSLRAMRVKKMRAVDYPCGVGNYYYNLPSEGFLQILHTLFMM